MSGAEIHISSALVHVRPERTQEVAAQIAAQDGAELHFAEAGKIIVTLEAATSGAIADRLGEIARLAGVLAATLVYHEVTTPEALGERVMQLTRRDAIKAKAAALAALAANVTLPAAAQPVAGGIENLEIKWSKAPCRFCGTGCGVMVGVKAGQVVATHGDTQAEVNRGLNCVKGYFLSKIMYGGDRLTTPLLRMRGGEYAKDGDFTPVSWEEAFDVMAAQAKRVLREKGPTAVGMFGSGQWTIWEGYAATKLMRAGFRSNNLDPNARHCMASAATAFIRTFGIDEPMGCYDDFEAADAFVLWGSNMAEMHPVLWTRLTDRRLSHPHVRVAVLSTYEHRSSDLADLSIVFKPGTDLAILNYVAQPHHRDRAGQPGLRRPAHDLPQGRHGHRLRPAARAPARAEGRARRRSRHHGPVGLRDLSGAGLGIYARFAWPSFRAWSPACSRTWPSSTPTRTARSCRSGRWGSTSMSAASGPTRWSTTSIS